MDEFKNDLLSLNSLQIVRKHVFTGHSKVLDDDKFYQLKEDVCTEFKIDFNDVLLVGSGKMGFSIKPKRRYGVFNDESDLDIAVVSNTLFQQIWKEAYSYKKKWCLLA